MSTTSDRIGQTGRAGMMLSLLCAIHCAAMPLVVGLLPFVGLSVLATPAFEFSMIALGVLFGYYSVIKGYLQIHRKSLPIWMLNAGVLVILFSHSILPEAGEPVFMAFGASLLAIAQIVNLRFVKRVQACTCAV